MISKSPQPLYTWKPAGLSPRIHPYVPLALSAPEPTCVPIGGGRIRIKLLHALLLPCRLSPRSRECKYNGAWCDWELTLHDSRLMCVSVLFFISFAIFFIHFFVHLYTRCSSAYMRIGVHKRTQCYTWICIQNMIPFYICKCGCIDLILSVQKWTHLIIYCILYNIFVHYRTETHIPQIKKKKTHTPHYYNHILFSFNSYCLHSHYHNNHNTHNNQKERKKKRTITYQTHFSFTSKIALLFPAWYFSLLRPISNLGLSNSSSSSWTFSYASGISFLFPILTIRFVNRRS